MAEGDRVEWTDARIQQFYNDNEKDHERFDARMQEFGSRFFTSLLAACVALIGLLGGVLTLLLNSSP